MRAVVPRQECTWLIRGTDKEAKVVGEDYARKQEREINKLESELESMLHGNL